MTEHPPAFSQAAIRRGVIIALRRVQNSCDDCAFDLGNGTATDDQLDRLADRLAELVGILRGYTTLRAGNAQRVIDAPPAGNGPT